MFQLRTFGGLTIERDGVPLDDLTAQRKSLTLLAVLAASESGSLGRDTLLAMLWPESDADRARRALNQTLHTLRRRLGVEVLLGTAELRLNPELIVSDIGTFVAALAAGDLDAAVQKYSGEFLEGVHPENAPEFEHWLETRRDHLGRRYRESLEQLARTAESRGDFAAAVAWWRRLQAADPLSSRIASGLIHSLDAAGDRAGALRQARVHEVLLREELGIQPDAAFMLLVDRLKSTRPPKPLTPSESVEAGPGTTRPLPPAERESGGRRVPLISAAVVTLVLVLAVSLAVRRSASSEALAADRVAVAVFENRTGDRQLDPIGNMASDWVTRGLARIPRLQVIDISAVYTEGRTGSGEPTDPQSFARRNHAGLVVAGNYYKQGDSLFFSTSIIDVARASVRRVLDPIGAHASDPLAAINDLEQRVAAALLTLTESTLDLLMPVEAQPPRYAAYLELVAAMELYWRGRFEESMPGLRRALELDAQFSSAAVALAVAAVGSGQCALVDSIDQSLRLRRDRLGELDRLSMDISRARCDIDWEEALRANYRRAELQRGSTRVQWTISANARRANRPAEAAAVLSPIDPAHDLRWMADPGKVFYWRELTAAQHMLGEYSAELATARRAARMNPRRLSTLYHLARGHAGAGRATEALRALEGVESLQPDPALVSGEIAAHMRPQLVGSAGWVLYQIATELLAHGNANAAGKVAERAVRWFENRPLEEARTVEHRITHALALELKGRYQQAEAVVAALVAEDTTCVRYRGMLGVLAAHRGHHTAAQQADQWLAAAPARRPPGEATLYRAQMAAVLGDVPRALDLIDALPHRVHPADFALLHSDPALNRLLGEPRFQSFIRPRG